MNKTIPPTLDELAALPREYLKTSEVAAVLGVTLYAPVIMARHKQFPFDIPFSGNRPKFPKRKFLEYMGWKPQASSRVSERATPPSPIPTPDPPQ